MKKHVREAIRQLEREGITILSCEQKPRNEHFVLRVKRGSKTAKLTMSCTPRDADIAVKATLKQAERALSEKS